MTFKHILVLAAVTITISLANIHLPVARKANIYSFPSSQIFDSQSQFHELNIELMSVNLQKSSFKSKNCLLLHLDIANKKFHRCDQQNNSLLMDLYNFLARFLIIISFGTWGLGKHFSVIEHHIKHMPKELLVFLYVVFGMLSLLLIRSAF